MSLLVDEVRSQHSGKILRDRSPRWYAGPVLTRYDPETERLSADPAGLEPSPVEGISRDRYEEVVAQIRQAERLTPSQIFEQNAKHVRRWLRARREEERALRG